MKNNTVILQHKINWFLRDENAPKEMDDCSIEHIENCIAGGYNQGELCVLGDDGETEYRGWWNIAAEIDVLLAAAPDLLEALSAIMAALDKNYGMVAADDPVLDQAAGAIAKAKG